MKRFSGIKFGIISAGISSVWMIYLFATKLVISPASRFSLLLVPLCLFAGIFISMYYQRKGDETGSLKFADAFKTGLQVAVSYSIIMALTTFMCQAVLYPEFTIDAIANAKARGIAEHVDVAKMNDILNKMKKDIEVGSQVTKTISGGLLTGTVVSLIFAGLMRRQ